MMSWSFKKEFYGSKEGKLNLERVREFLEVGYTLVPYTFIEGFFRTVYWDGEYNSIYRHISKPWPDMLIAQKPEQKFAMHFSGGFDSSILAYLYDRPDADYFHVRGPETEKAEAMGEILKGRLHILDINDNDFMEAAETILGQYSEPECDAAGVLAYIVSREAKTMGHDLIVTGDCADTVFGGHTWGPNSEKAVDVWKTLEPNNLLGLKTLMPFGHPALKAWAKATLSPELTDYNKNFLREFVCQLGLPDIITQQKKIGWGGCWDYPNSSTSVERMQSFIKDSRFAWLQNLIHYKRGYSLFRLYALVLWLGKNYVGEGVHENDYAKHFFEKEDGYPETSPFVEIYAKQKIRPKIEALQQIRGGRLILFGTDPFARALLFYMKEEGFALPDIIADEQSPYNQLAGVPVVDLSSLEWRQEDVVLLGSKDPNVLEMRLDKAGFQGAVFDVQKPLVYAKASTGKELGAKKNISSVSQLAKGVKIIIYGAGEAGKQLYDKLLDFRKDIEVLFFLDTYKQGEFCGKSIVLANEFVEKVKTIAYDHIIVASMYYEEVESFLDSNNIDCYSTYWPEIRKNQMAIDPNSDNYHRLKALKNRHEGQRCFVIGNGPSLMPADLDRLGSEITFASNKIYLAFDQTDWRPTYYYADHHEIIQEDLNIINGLPESVTKIFPTRIQYMNIPIKDAVYFELVWDVFYPNEPQFSIDALDRLYWGSNVTYSLLQLAFYMGFREIYLLGVDCKFSAPDGCESGDKKFKVVEEMKNNHFHPEYSKVGSLVFPPNMERHYLSYKSARTAMERFGGEIFNSTRGGELDIFDRVDFESLF